MTTSDVNIDNVFSHTPEDFFDVTLDEVLRRRGENPCIGSLYFSHTALYRREGSSDFVLSIISSVYPLGGGTSNCLPIYFYYHICILLYNHGNLFSSRTITTVIPTWTSCNMISFIWSVSFFLRRLRVNTRLRIFFFSTDVSSSLTSPTPRPPYRLL